MEFVSTENTDFDQLSYIYYSKLYDKLIKYDDIYDVILDEDTLYNIISLLKKRIEINVFVLYSDLFSNEFGNGYNISTALVIDNEEDISLEVNDVKTIILSNNYNNEDYLKFSKEDTEFILYNIDGILECYVDSNFYITHFIVNGKIIKTSDRAIIGINKYDVPVVYMNKEILTYLQLYRYLMEHI